MTIPHKIKYRMCEMIPASCLLGIIREHLIWPKQYLVWSLETIESLRIITVDKHVIDLVKTKTDI